MSTAAAPSVETRRSWTDPKDQAQVETGPNEVLTITRAAAPSATEMVFVEINDKIAFWLTPQQAADFAEAMHKVSGMATSSRSACFLASAVRDGMSREGVTKSRVQRVTGITRYRLRRILSGVVPMTHDELVAISEVRP